MRMPRNKVGAVSGLLAMAAAMAATATPAAAQLGSGVVVCTNCSNLVTQALQQAAQVEQLTTQIATLQNNIQQYENMVKNSLKLPDAVFGDAMGDIKKVMDTVKAVKGLAFTASNIEGEFKRRYRTLTNMTDGKVTYDDLQAAYRAWSDDTNESVLTTFKALGEEAKTIESEADLMEKLQERASSAEGQMEALAVGNELAVQAVAQTQKLRSLQMGLSALSGRRNTVDAQRGRLTTRNSLLMPCAFQ